MVVIKYNKNENHTAKYKNSNSWWAKIGPYGRAWVRVSIMFVITIILFIVLITVFE